MAGDHFYTISAAERDAAVQNSNYKSEGTACWVIAPDSPLVNPRGLGEHFYTTSASERDNAVANVGYLSEGVSCFVLESQLFGSVPLYRMVSGINGDHFYTISAAERDNAIANLNYTSEGVACYVFDIKTAENSPLFRLLSKNTGEHFYTTSVLERDNAIANLNYADEGTKCFVYTAPRPNAVAFHRLVRASDPQAPVPLFRAYNPNNGDHFYTTSAVEADFAVQRYGYRGEGKACYVYDKPRGGVTPFYRCVSTKIGDHFYTTDLAERDNAVAALGYRDEGVACYVYANQTQGFVPLYRLVQTAAAAARIPDGRPQVQRAELTWLNTWIQPTQFPKPGQAFVVYFSLANIGNKASGPFKIRLELDGGASRTDIAAPGYNPGQGDYVYWQFPYGLGVGHHYVYAYLDILNQVPESSKANNISYSGFGVS
ncbi:MULTISPECIES: CARDB domain-containing protein [unclassified Bradyrhizobium]|uniref:CARDB domain-containing protein n=1 Tax=unclassified Bradyrhizobium TaxID=2631580 RepID=UPI0020B2B897|nr:MULTISPECIES: CARDB domain-containing protein [unclassified Bradyrhizobium]MCP3402153.1 hypothetical protein [Bradyrhizobium sp. CCGB20]MCP3410642.1 hypothetical protein [Bradyrhizobium sp. CCGB01]